jgi:hypothetical protein
MPLLSHHLKQRCPLGLLVLLVLQLLTLLL